MTAASTVISPVVLQMQLGLLQLQFRAWEIVLARCDRDSWFEARRRECAGNGRCMLVAGSAARMLDLLSAGPASAAERQRAS
ncbi:MAG: hypothetical protein ABSF03_33440 [Streptosporangiaceae bacterium]|jgi:hypothetical protein